MSYVWGILSLVILGIAIYLGVGAVISFGWAIGWGIVTLVIFLIALDILEDMIGIGTIVAILLILLLLQVFVW